MKRVIDFSAAAFLLLALSPLMLILGMLVYFFIGPPILFRQQRPGFRCEPFLMVKFRTMTDARDDHGCLLPDSKRLTSIGKFMRSTSMDELPELWNVLVGDMSLVGPRPLLMEYVGNYTDRERRRHEVRPGITGWAQVNGRNYLELKDRFELDVWYVDNRSWKLDARILLKTAIQVLRREGARPDGYDGTGPSSGTMKRKF